MPKRLLLLSNSTNLGEEYLRWPETYIKEFLGNEVKKILFIPFAGVTISYDNYAALVAARMEQMGHKVVSIHQLSNDTVRFDDFNAIAIGGGNTFQLAYMLQKENLLEPIKEAVLDGMPFIGWSAGSNITCPTIMTTNDMPIVQPASFAGLNLISFQINPHFTDKTIEGHGGETREARIREFLTLNPDKVVAGVPEGSLLQVEDDKVYFNGKEPLRVFKTGPEVKKVSSGEEISELLNYSG